MKDIVIIGAGGFGREVQWLLERINEREKTWNILGYVDDGKERGTLIDDLPVLDGIEFLREVKKPLAVVCAVGASKTRKRIMEGLGGTDYLEFPNIIDPSVRMSERITMGKGNIVCAGNILTVDITLGDFNIINLDCTVGHDAVLHSYVTVYPSVNISGCVEVGEVSELGTGSHIIQGVKIGSHAIVGGGTRFSQDVPPFTTCARDPAAYCGLNLIGLRRRGFSNEMIENIHNAYRLIYQSKLKLADALQRIREEVPMSEEIAYIIDFIESSKKGFVH